MKNLVRIFVLAIVFSLFFQNCSVGLLTHQLEGRVTSELTREPVAGAKVTLLEHNNGDSGTVLGSATTDNDGSFVIIYKRAGGDQWEVIVSSAAGNATVQMPRKQKTIDIEV